VFPLIRFKFFDSVRFVSIQDVTRACRTNIIEVIANVQHFLFCLQKIIIPRYVFWLLLPQNNTTLLGTSGLFEKDPRMRHNIISSVYVIFIVLQATYFRATYNYPTFRSAIISGFSADYANHLGL
jgi:hypothetical protein